MAYNGFFCAFYIFTRRLKNRSLACIIFVLFPSFCHSFFPNCISRFACYGIVSLFVDIHITSRYNIHSVQILGLAMNAMNGMEKKCERKERQWKRISRQIKCHKMECKQKQIKGEKNAKEHHECRQLFLPLPFSSGSIWFSYMFLDLIRWKKKICNTRSHSIAFCIFFFRLRRRGERDGVRLRRHAYINQSKHKRLNFNIFLSKKIRFLLFVEFIVMLKLSDPKIVRDRLRTFTFPLIIA